MSINDISEKIKRYRPKILIGLSVALIGFGCFGGGRLYQIESEKEPISVESAPLGPNDQASSTLTLTTVLRKGGQYLGSRTGKVYYYPWCSLAERIASSSRIYFDSREEAEEAGYKKAKNCPGLK